MGLFDKFGSKNEQPRTRRTDAVSGIPFPAYKGRKPYMFISYAHVDSPTVFSLIAEYYDLGYNVWYDEGIEPGIEWPEEIGKALGGSKLFVVFMSPAAAASGNVRNEINFAIKHHIPLITVYIEETELTAGLDLQIGARQAINWYNMDKESYRRKFTYSFDAVLRPGSRPVVPYDVPASPAKPDVHEPNPSVPPAPPSPAVQTAPLPASSTDDVHDGFKWDGTKLLSYLGDAKDIALPASATMLCSSAFRDNGTIETITIPASVSNIDSMAFDNCPILKQVVIEGGYVAVGSPVAAGCPNLSFRCHRNSQTYNNLKQAFAGPVTFFPGEDFDIEHGRLNKYLGSDKVVRLPKEVAIIGGFAFNSCPNLESVIYAGDNGAIFDNAFIGCPKLRNITIGKSFSSIAPKAFIGCPNVRFSYYRGRKPDRFDTLFPDPSIASEIAPDEDSSIAPGALAQHTPDAPAPSAGEPSVVFASPEFKRIVRAELNLIGDDELTKDKCDQVTSLYVCGNAIGRRFNAYTNNGATVHVVPIAGSGGTMESVGRGSLDTLDDIVHLRNITKLIAPYQSFYDLSPLSGTRIDELDISMNTLDDLSPLSHMRFLRKLTLSYANMDSLAPLSQCAALEFLTFSGISQQRFDELCEKGSESLTMLLISDGKLHSINRIDRLENLDNLCINDSGVTDIEPALKLKHLRKLGIKDLDIPDLSIIRSFTSLKVLTVNDTQKAEVARLYGGEFPFKLF